MNKDDKPYAIALLIIVVFSAVVSFVGPKVADHLAYARLENPATYQG